MHRRRSRVEVAIIVVHVLTSPLSSFAIRIVVVAAAIVAIVGVTIVAIAVVAVIIAVAVTARMSPSPWRARSNLVFVWDVVVRQLLDHLGEVIAVKDAGDWNGRS